MEKKTDENTKIEAIPEEKAPVKVAPRSAPLKAGADGALLGASLEEQYRLAKYYVQSGMLPKGYDTPEKALIGFQYAIEMGLKPLTAIKNICVINGHPNLWGELPLSLVRKSGKLKSIREYFIDKDYNEICLKNKNLKAEKWAAICDIQRSDNDEIPPFVWTVDDVAKSIQGPVWKTYPQIMWKRKVRSIALKDIFGDVLGTFDIAEYNHDQAPDVPGTMIDVKEKRVEQAASVAEIADEVSEEVVMITPPSPVEQAIAKDVKAIKLAESIGGDESLSNVEKPEEKVEKEVDNPVEKPVKKAVKKPTGNPID